MLEKFLVKHIPRPVRVEKSMWISDPFVRGSYTRIVPREVVRKIVAFSMNQSVVHLLYRSYLQAKLLIHLFSQQLMEPMKQDYVKQNVFYTTTALHKNCLILPYF